MFKVVSKVNKKFFAFLLIVLFLFSIFNVSTTADEERSDLIIHSINCPNVFSEDKEVKIPIKIKNQGFKDVADGEKIGICLKIDGQIVSTNSTFEGLDENTSSFMNITWTPTTIDSDQHLLSIIVDYEGFISESNENNNVWDKYINYSEKETDLEIVSLDLSDSPVVAELVDISATIVNSGMKTNASFDLVLESSIDGKIDNITVNQTMNKDSTKTFTFSWTPSKFGNQNISLDLIYRGENQDKLEKTIFVDIGNLAWWNSSWHYRYFVITEGFGNISLDVNFAQLLDAINSNSSNLDYKTLRIIEYKSDGTIKDEIEKYKFNRTAIDPSDNLTGKLIWDTNEINSEKYFCIYFDVEENIGNRSALNETNLTNFGNASFYQYSFVQGWGYLGISPNDDGYCSFGSTKIISVKTESKAKNVTAELYYNDTLVDVLFLENMKDNTDWETNYTFDSYKGNWTIKFSSTDNAGYGPQIISHDFFVGMPDAELSNISFKTNYPATSPTIYIHDILNITAKIKGYNANIQDLEISFYIFDLDNNSQLVYFENSTIDVFKDTQSLLSTFVLSNKAGNYNITVKIDPNNKIQESNETNNQLTKQIKVYNLPDLAVTEIILPEEQIVETNTVKIKARISNNGDLDIFNYTAVLYLESTDQGLMTYSNEINSKLFSIPKNSVKELSFIWNVSEAGEWFVGVKVLVNESKRDVDIDNNRLLSTTNLIIQAVERNAPSISDVSTYPTFPRQGESVEISSKVFDDSGIDYVKIQINDPSNTTVYNGDMVRSSGNEFKIKFKETFSEGEYTFQIKTKDLSIHAKENILTDTFLIFEDSTTPEILYFDTNPSVIEKNKEFLINCIAKDNIGIKNVEVIINTPKTNIIIDNMGLSSEGKYIYKDIYSSIGKYSYYIKVEDKAGNTKTTERKYFWITLDKNDTDSDGMPDSWEQKYDLDPKNSSDAELDYDGDGFTNLREYNLQNNPKKDILMQNIAPRITDNIGYIIASIFVFILIVALTMYSKRRRFL